MLQGTVQTNRRAKQLRKALSFPEVLLWQQLKLRPKGLKFRKQHPSGKFIADFYCHEARLVIEIDGEVHNRGGQPEYDLERDQWFKTRGIAVLRISAKIVLSEMQIALATIIAAASERVSPLRLAYGDPPPLTGEDFSGSSSWNS